MVLHRIKYVNGLETGTLSVELEFRSFMFPVHLPDGYLTNLFLEYSLYWFEDSDSEVSI